jgi:hypothetical protein
MRKAMGTAAALVGLLSACDDAATLEQLRARAAYDLDCPQSKIKTVELDERTRGVSGCGQRATYVEACDRVGQYGVKSDCTWVMNSDAHRAKKKSDEDE